MVHKCTPERCLKDKKPCSKEYPKLYSEVTRDGKNGYPIYRRRQGNQVIIGNSTITNQDIVPYNPYLSTKFNAHINVGVCS
eukprot:Awhi_evm1s12661